MKELIEKTTQRAYERLLKYVVVPTTSSEEHASQSPSFAGERVLAEQLAAEMTAMGVSDVCVDDNGYVYGRIQATPGFECCRTLGFLAHLDTAPDFSGEGVKPQIIAQYDGGAVALGESGLVLSPEKFPHLKQLAGRTLITTDGTTLLGADDKAGIAEILTMAEVLLGESAPAHGEIAIAFTPDEEIGSGADLLDLERFGADVAYTMDGGIEQELSYENFNACSAEVVFHGTSIHPGEAKNKMVNAALLAMEFNAMLPAADIPARTEGYEGFFHLTGMQGNEETATLSYIVRDHDADAFAFRQYTLRHAAKRMNEAYGDGRVELTIRESYRNMKEMIAPHMELIAYAKESMEAAGLTPMVEPTRGGTDGARLSFRGLPCPNLGTGGFAYHGPYEHITAEGMDAAVLVMLGIVERFAGEAK